MSAIDYLDRMVRAGVPYETARDIARAFEADIAETVAQVAADVAAKIAQTRKGNGAERTRRWREAKNAKQSVTVTSRDVTSVTAPPVPPPSSPTPPSSTTLPPDPTPFTPLKGGVSPALAEPDLKAVAEEIWQLQPVIGGKRRSTRPDVLKALRAAVDRRGQDPVRIVAASGAYYRLPDCRKDSGQFAMGAAVLLAEDRWRDFEPTTQARPAPKAEPAVYAAHVRHYRDTGEWKPAWGPKPQPHREQERAG